MGTAVVNYRNGLKLDVSQPPAAIKLRSVLPVVMEDHKADVNLASGRIDSTTMDYFGRIESITAGMKGAPDLKYAEIVAKTLNITHESVVFEGADQAMRVLKNTIELMQSYDLATLSDMVVFACMKSAKLRGKYVIRTGDPADELFEGDGKDIAVWRFEHLQSKRIAERLGLVVDHPYADERLIEIAKTLRRDDNERYVDGNVPSDLYEYYRRKQNSIQLERYKWTKIPLRQAMLGVLPNDVVYRMKAHLQHGSWTNILLSELAKIGRYRVDEFEQQGIHFWSKFREAHAGLRVLWKEKGLTEPKITNSLLEFECDWCGGAVNRTLFICYTCGGFPPSDHTLTIE